MKNETAQTVEQLSTELQAAQTYIAELEAALATSRQEAESSRRFSDVVREGIIFHEKGVVIDVNPGLVTMFGYSDASELRGRKLLDFIAPECQADAARRLAAGETQPYEMLGVRKDGSALAVETAAQIYEFEGRKIRVTSVLDITARKKVEQALRASEARKQALLAAIPDLIFVFRRDGTHVEVKVNNADDLMMAPTEAIGKNIRDLGFTPEQLTLFFEHVEQAILTHTHQMFEYQVTTPRGTTSWEASMVALNDDEVLVTCRDITERKEAEAERARLQQQVIEAQRRALQELSTPIIPVMDRIIVMPLVGSIDTLRARDITRTLLAGISRYRAKIVIVDITGVPLVDSGVADHLNKTIMAARLKGAQTIVTGMSDAVAEAIVELGIDWSGIQTLGDLQTGLIMALNTLGFKLSK